MQGAVGIALRQAGEQAAGDMRHQVQPDEIQQAEDARPGHAHGPPGHGIGFLDREAQLRGVVHRRLHPQRADAVGDEARRVLRHYHRLAEAPVGGLADGGEHARIGPRAGHHLQQPHVARRVEEMRDQEMPRAFRRHSLGQRLQRDGGGVGGQHRPRLHHPVEPRIEFALGLQPLGDRLHHPVAIGEEVEVALQLARLHQLRRAAMHEGSRIGLEHRRQRLRRTARHDIQQHHRQARIGHLRRDAGAHHPGADDADPLDRAHSTASSTVAMPWPPPMHWVASA